MPDLDDDVPVNTDNRPTAADGDQDVTQDPAADLTGES